ncbi:fibronectin type III domain-containing protein [Candidatus Poriferisocius sp.]|uniref:fibronectin type III domain-containing protein n=1 Tax=Candidatus Poriferisocius sp. TaxID=3101276 RepID=UPI003B014387
MSSLPTFTADGDKVAETHVYTYTFLTDLEEEGPPAPPTAPVTREFNTEGQIRPVRIRTPSVAPSGYGSINRKRIYRSATGTAGTTTFRLLATIPLTLDEYDDAVLTSQLGEELVSIDWDPPPEGLKGIVTLPNGVIAGFDGRDVYFSEPYQPHAWPRTYIQTVDDDIVGMGNFGLNLVVGTEGRPYIMSGTHPSEIVPARMEFEQSCVAKRSFSYVARQGVVFASPEGLVLVGPGGGSFISTPYYERADWKALNPEQFLAAYHDGIYMAFTPEGGLAFGPDVDGVVRIREPGVKALFRDAGEDKVYLLDQDNRVGEWSTDVFQDDRIRTMQWLSRPYPGPARTFSAAQVTADEYPVGLRLYGDYSLVYETLVQDRHPFRLPAGIGLFSDWEYEVVGTSEVFEVQIGLMKQMIGYDIGNPGVAVESLAVPDRDAINVISQTIDVPANRYFPGTTSVTIEPNNNNQLEHAAHYEGEDDRFITRIRIYTTAHATITAGFVEVQIGEKRNQRGSNGQNLSPEFEAGGIIRVTVNNDTVEIPFASPAVADADGNEEYNFLPSNHDTPMTGTAAWADRHSSDGVGTYASEIEFELRTSLAGKEVITVMGDSWTVPAEVTAVWVDWFKANAIHERNQNTLAGFDFNGTKNLSRDEIEVEEGDVFTVNGILSGGYFSINYQLPPRPAVLAAPATPPAAPTTSAQTSDSLTINFDAVLGATGYKVYYSTDATVEVAIDDSVTVTGTSATISGLDANTNYWVAYSAFNTAGEGGLSPVLATATPQIPAPATPAAAPTVSARVSDSLTVTIGAVATATSYRVYYSTDATVNTSDPYVTVTGTEATITGLTESTNYWVAYLAINAGGSSALSPVLATSTIADPDTPPGVPANVAYDVGTRTLSWDAVPRADTYEINYDTAASYLGDNTSPDHTGITATSFVNPRGLWANGYWIQVRARNTHGVSAYSDPILISNIIDLG